MLKMLAAISLFATLSIVIASPIAASLVSRFSLMPGRRGPLVVAVSLVISLALISISASWSYGLLGANTFPYILGFLSLCSCAALVLKSVRMKWRLIGEFERSDLLLLLFLPLLSLLTRTYWTGLFGLQLASGPGPDSAQNFMVVSAQNINQTTWAASRDYFFNQMGTTNLWDGLYHLYQMPSFVDQAAIDYLVYGTRWGLSIPYSQLMRLNKSLIGGEQAIVLGIGLMAIGFLIYGAVKHLTSRSVLSIFAALISVASTPLLVQFFNGGIAQIWATPGLVLLSIVLVFSITHSREMMNSTSMRRSLIALAAIGWLATAVTYIDSAMALATQAVITSGLLYAFRKKSLSGKALFISFSVSGILAALVVAPYTWAAIQTLGIRLRLAQGTGIDFKNWPWPSELLGLFDVWTGTESIGRDPIILLASILASIYIVWLVIRNLPNETSQEIRLLGISIFLSMFVILLWSLNTGSNRNYAYVKFSTYLTPLLLLVLTLRWASLESTKRKKLKTNSNWYGLAVPGLFTVAVLGSSIPASGAMYQTAEYVVPQAQFTIYNDKQAQEELSNYNYLTTYRPISNLLGSLGNVHWISKAPNDLNLSTRLNNELRIICFMNDVACNPTTPELVSNLNKYGLRVFKSPITTQEFNSLKVLDRYNAATDAVGQERLKIPEKYLGGNPLLK